MEYVIKLIEIEINYIIIEITPAIKLLPSSLLKCFFNCRNYEDFTIQSMDEMDAKYIYTSCFKYFIKLNIIQ